MFEKYLSNLKRGLKTGVANLAKGPIKKSIQDKSPVDTGEYIAGNKDSGVKTEGDKTYIELYNDSQYAKEVEYGFRREPVNWHKNRRAGGPVIYRGVGARVYSRTIDENRFIIRNTLIDVVISGSKASKIS